MAGFTRRIYWQLARPVIANENIEAAELAVF
jgi:hypothetical protein